MVVHSRRIQEQRKAMTVVEAALLLSLFMLFLFGVFEYGRYLLLLHVSTNAARDGARYATVNVDKDTNFVTVPDGTKVSITQYVRDRMGGADTLIDSFQVEVFACDNTNLYLDPPQITPKTGANWNEATFTERIAVRITGQYRPILPVFVFFFNSNQTIPLNISAVSGSEG